MKKITVIFGNITFDENTEGESIAIIHSIEGINFVEEKKAEEFGDENCNVMTSYIIPSQYSGKITWEC